MAFCTQCGESVDDDAAFCTSCGAATVASEPDHESRDEVSPGPVDSVRPSGFGFTEPPLCVLWLTPRTGQRILYTVWKPCCTGRPTLRAVEIGKCRAQHADPTPPPNPSEEVSGPHCTSCGESIESDSAFCVWCGTTVDGAVPPPSPAQQPPLPRQPPLPTKT